MKIVLGSSERPVKLSGSTAIFQFAGSATMQQATAGAGPVGDYSDTTLGSVGSPGDFGYDSPSIARWNVVELQELEEFPVVGLVAFHVNHVAKVEFSVDGGSWVEVTEMKLNPSTGVYEYCVSIDTTGLADDRELELRAKITPSTAGQVYGIPPITIRHNYSSELVGWCAPDGDDSTGDATELKPCRTPHRALQVLVGDTAYSQKVTIYCEAGEYVPAKSGYNYNPPAGPGWFTITSAPGVDASQVVFKSSIDSGTILYAGIRTLYTRYKDVSFETNVTGRNLLGGTVTNVWIDGVTVTLTLDGGFTNNIWQGNSWDKSYCTSCSFSQFNNGPNEAQLVRNCTLDQLTEDALVNIRLCANCVVGDQIYTEPFHPDYCQWLDSDEHTIFYGVAGLDIQGQAIYAAREAELYENAAFVNIFAALSSGATIENAPVSRIDNDDANTLAIRNVIVDSCTVLNGQNFIISEGTSPSTTSRDIVFRNNVTYQLATNLSSPVISTSNNWYMKPDLDGSFTCAGGGTYTGSLTPTYNSIADLVPTQAAMVGVVTRPTIKTDATGSLRNNSGIIGALG